MNLSNKKMTWEKTIWWEKRFDETAFQTPYKMRIGLHGYMYSKKSVKPLKPSPAPLPIS